MTNGVSREEGSPNLPGHRGRRHGGGGGLDTWEASHGGDYAKYGSGARRPAATFYGPGGNFAFETSESSELVNYSAILRKLWRRKFLVISIAVLGIGGATAIIVRMPAHYVAHAFVAIGDPFAKSRLSYGTNQGGALASLPDTGTVQTEVEVLKSPQLALEVIRDLKLENNPEFNPAASPAEQPGIWSRAMEWLFGPQAAADPRAEAAAELSQTIDNFLGRLRVSAKDPSRMVDVAFDSSNPRLSMQIANAVVDRYVNQQLEGRLQSAQKTSGWLHDKIVQLQAKVEDSERAVEQFRSQAGLFSAPDRSPLLLKQMTDASAELANARTASAAIEARLSQLRTSGQPSGRGSPTSDIVDSPLMATLDGQQADAEQKLAEASASLGEKNPATLGLRERLRHIQVAKRNEGLRVTASLENDLKIARMKERDLSDRLGRLQGDVAEMNRSEIKLRALEREAQADRLVLNNFISRFKETSQEGDISSQRPDAQIVSYAQLPVNPDRPKRGLLILIAGMASLIGGALVALLVEKADRRLHSLEEVEGRLKVTGLGMLPFSKAAQLSPSEAARYGFSYREAAKATYSRLFWAGAAPKVTVVTSALPGEGKTTLALSLAAMAAQSGQRVLFVDADFWKSGAGATLGIRSSAGLAELLEGKAKLADAIISDVASGADIILPGTFSRASLLAWIGKLPELLDSLRSRYDVIIVDSPPILAVSEAVLLAGHADATVMAIRWASTPWDAAKTALKKLHDAGAAVAGSVLTMVPESQPEKYGYAEAAYFSKNLASYRPATGAVTRSAELQRSGKRAPRLSSRSASPSIKSDSPPHALLVLDIQEVTCRSGRHSPSPEACDRLIDTINRLSQVASRFGIMVLYGDNKRISVVAKLFSPLRMKKLAGNSNERLKKVSGYSFTKPGRDAFSYVKLDDVLREHGIDHLFLAGSDGATSIKQTARSALDLGYRVTFIQDGIFTAFERKWERALKDFESSAAFAVTSEEFAELAVAVHKASEAQRRPQDTRVEHHRAHSLEGIGSLPTAAAQSSSWLGRFVFPYFRSDRTAAQQLHAVNGASPPPGTKPAPGTVAAMLRNIKRVSGTLKTALAKMVTTVALPGAPTHTGRARRRREIAPIAASLVAAAVAGWWLYRSEVANHVEMTIPAATLAGDDVAQVNQVPQRERAEALTRELTRAQRELEMRSVLSRNASDDASHAQEAAEPTAVELRQAVQQQRDKAETLTRDLAAARSEIETQTATAHTAGSEAAQAKEAAERSAATARQALEEERARADALARDLDAARREIEALTAAASAASGETAQVREDAMRTAQELQRSQQQERERADALARNLAAVRREIEAQVAASGKSGDEATRLQQAAERAAAELRQALQQEHDKAEKLARELATARPELETQAAALTKAGDKTAQNQQLTELRQALQQAEASAAAYQESLAQERARNQGLEQQLAARRDATPGRGRNATASLSDTPGPTQAPATDKPATAPLATRDKPVIAAAPADDKAATMAARLTAPEASGNPEAPRLMARASLLLSQGNVVGARTVLDHAAETGSAPALFALAETYDPAILSAWGTFGTQGDVAKAQELYAKALAGGVLEAKDRLNALR